MGIETYELLAEVERVFGVPNAYNGRADTFDTVGDLYRYILERRRPRPPVACLSAATFRRVRQGLMTVLGVPRERIRSDTQIAQFLPVRGRRESWKRLQEAIDLKLPPWNYRRES